MAELQEGVDEAFPKYAAERWDFSLFKNQGDHTPCNLGR